MRKEIIRFGIVGVAATAIHYAIYYLLLPHLDKNIAYTGTDKKGPNGATVHYDGRILPGVKEDGRCYFFSAAIRRFSVSGEATEKPKKPRASPSAW